MPNLGIAAEKTPKAERSPSTRIIAWAAGFCEGEANFRKSSSSQEVSVAQKDSETLLFLQQFFGGRVAQDSRGYWSWNLSGTRARGFMLTIYVMLSVRRRGQIRVAMS